MDNDKLKPILEALFAASDKPLSVNQLFELFVGDIDQPGKDDIRKAIQELVEKYQHGGMELKQVASGYRFQVRADYEVWVARLWEQKPPRYSRALMETLALIAYRQPITRGEIEDIRGVSVSTNIIKTLQERDWVKSLGHKEVPGSSTPSLPSNRKTKPPPTDAEGVIPDRMRPTWPGSRKCRHPGAGRDPEIWPLSPGRDWIPACAGMTPGLS
jgi:segregation and condensation protein B